MKILVTGSEGNIGSRLIPYLKSCGHDVFGFDHVQGTNHIVGDINNPIELAQAFYNHSPEAVYHLAAMVSRVTCEASPAITIQTNIAGTNNVVQLCSSFKSKLVHFSTSEVYGNIGGLLTEDRHLEPNNIYGLSKKISEDIVRYFLQDAIIVRPFMFYDENETKGEHRSAMIRFAEHLLRREKVTAHRNSFRSWMYINDAVKVLEKLLYVKGFEIVNIGSEEIIETRQLAEMMCDYIGIDYGYIVDDDLPERMTLTKVPDVRKQVMLTGISSEMKIAEGIKLVINKMK